ncbi:hypothetical protein DICPUDRAFT_77767 [Dictyostelium purpureum]|uniref:Uncharacterized protein n=1 Tax=Dictyostelium purpureum TaxID=5786 RepID=F0ZHJ7_DICPU|nr:uncharacterized protein DICPUDRAFT_77767 [Dictyostelium purpureum]EGC36582.1 hypothetical protein DICPUDRAFT_77767 [Dictyostelium purpureum]|eukprot:XP_003286886.1 hypothetical protein DICPUDRAFT_77767 [Dictyostelium purpureum]
MSKYKCYHDEFSIGKLKKYGYTVYFEQLVEEDGFPEMENGYCTEACKEKMKEIYTSVMEEYLKYSESYFEDARIFKYGENKHYVHKDDYESFFKKKEIFLNPIDRSDKLVLVCFKVGILNGKPVRLCDLPEGVKCDYDADNLPGGPIKEEEDD